MKSPTPAANPTCALTPAEPISGAIAPLFWQHGEPAEVLREELQQMRQAGIRQCILEPRPHPDYLGPGWWATVDVILAEADRLGMQIWFFDDSRFPSGYAAGRIASRHPHLLKVYLAARIIDGRGPLPAASFRIGAWLEADEQLVAVVAAQRVSGDSDDLLADNLVDLTDQVTAGRLFWDLPAGWWRLFVLVRTRRGGEEGTQDYLNPVVPAAVDAYLAEIHESFYRRYGDRFGKSIAGFFTDEPRFGNAPTYEAVLGRYPMVLPWCDDLLAELEAGWDGSFRRVLPALWHDAGELSARARYRYLDVVSRRFGENFSGRLGQWCRAHGVRLIGHVVEDNGAHARLGYGAGHFFRAISGQDAGGVDYVYQVWPGCPDGRIQTPFGPWDLSFFYWGAAKLASSAAHLDPQKAGRTMGEVFGAYGWQLGLPGMKWLTDHACGRGVNFLVPHAFSPRYPDPDCPPHFYARGTNPQWRHFGRWAAYAERLCHLFTGGQHLATAAVLYHAEAEWAGRCEPFHLAVRELARCQIDCDVVPLDTLLDQQLVRLEAGRFTINGEQFRCLVVPFAERLPVAGVRRFIALAQAGVRVVFTGALPSGLSDAGDAAAELAALRGQPLITVCPLAQLPGLLTVWGLNDVAVAPSCPHLHLYRYRRGPLDLWLCVNEDTNRNVATTVRIREPRHPAGCDTVGQASCLSLGSRQPRHPVGYDALTDELLAVPYERAGDCLAVSLQLEPYESLILAFGEQPSGSTRPRWRPGGEVQSVTGPWEIATAPARPGAAFTAWRKLAELGDLSRSDRLSGFAGTIAYETDLRLDRTDRELWLDLGRVHQVTQVFLDGRDLGARICPPHRYRLGRPSAGTHRLRVEVATTPVGVLGDNAFDRAVPQEPLGLVGPVRIVA